MISKNSSELLVCVTCRFDNNQPDDNPRPGQQLFDVLSQQKLPDMMQLVGVRCLQNCKKACTVALRGQQRWTYIFGNVNQLLHMDVLLHAAERYHRTTDGIIAWNERPDHFKKNCIARIPPLLTADV